MISATKGVMDPIHFRSNMEPFCLANEAFSKAAEDGRPSSPSISTSPSSSSTLSALAVWTGEIWFRKRSKSDWILSSTTAIASAIHADAIVAGSNKILRGVRYLTHHQSGQIMAEADSRISRYRPSEIFNRILSITSHLRREYVWQNGMDMLDDQIKAESFDQDVFHSEDGLLPVVQFLYIQLFIMRTGV